MRLTLALALTAALIRTAAFAQTRVDWENLQITEQGQPFMATPVAFSKKPQASCPSLAGRYSCECKVEGGSTSPMCGEIEISERVIEPGVHGYTFPYSPHEGEVTKDDALARDKTGRKIIEWVIDGKNHRLKERENAAVSSKSKYSGSCAMNKVVLNDSFRMTGAKVPMISGTSEYSYELKDGTLRFHAKHTIGGVIAPIIQGSHFGGPSDTVVVDSVCTRKN